MFPVVAAIALTVLLLGVVAAVFYQSRIRGFQPPARLPAPNRDSLLEQTAELEREKVRLELDIEKHRKTEEALRHSEEKYRALIEHANDLIIIAQDGVMKFTNPMTSSTLGYTARELAQMPFTEIITPEDRELVLDRYLRRLHGEDVPARYKFRICNRGGQVLWVEINTVIVDWEGRPASLSFLRDVTDQIRADEAVREAKQAAEDANHVKGRFLANMSHELRTPMNGIIGMTELTLATPVNLEQRSYLESVQQSADYMLSLINTILDFSKIEAAKLRLNPADFALRDELSQTIKIVAAPAAEKQLELVCDVKPDVPDRLHGDAGRLRQILFNLVGNAIKFTERGEVVLVVEQLEHIDEQIVLRFTIRDTGIGIPPAKQQMIFEPFGQADDSITRQYGGTGLGLSICKQLVHMMDGDLTLDSVPGEGSSFSFTARFAVGQPPVEGESVSHRIERVLVIENHAPTCEALCNLLLSWRFTPTGVTSLEAGNAALADAVRAGDPYRLAIVDERTCDGLPTELERQAALVRPHTGLILLRPMSSQHRRRELSDGGQPWISIAKPVMPSILLETILLVLDDCRSEPVISGEVEHSDAPRRVLLVEDNLINQRVAMSWLEKRGHQVALVTSGEAALQRLAQDRFDVVLMDLEMPGMGGIATTARIRQRESGGAARLPIVAMTAHALAGDRERCLAAGMDHYLSKPIRANELFAVVEEFPAQALAGSTARSDAEPAQAESPVFDRGQALASVGGDESLLAEIIGIFISDAPRSLASLRAALDRGQFAEAHRLAHSIKNSASYFGATGIRELAFQLEQSTQRADVARSADLNQTLAEQIRGLIEQLEQSRTDREATR